MTGREHGIIKKKSKRESEGQTDRKWKKRERSLKRESFEKAVEEGVFWDIG